MKLLIAGLAAVLLLAGAPVWADSWKDESGHGWRMKHWEKQKKYWEEHHKHQEESGGPV